MKASALTPGIVFSIDLHMREGNSDAAASLIKAAGIDWDDAKDRRVISQMFEAGSIDAKTFDFICDHGKAVSA